MHHNCKFAEISQADYEILHLQTLKMHAQMISSSAMAERPRELSDLKGVGHFEAKF